VEEINELATVDLDLSEKRFMNQELSAKVNIEQLLRLARAHPTPGSQQSVILGN
jgi:hypothetical protein